MICLTGDIHHSSLKTGNQEACDITEIQVTQRYVELLKAANVKATFFITGRSFAEEWKDLQPVCSTPLISIQGHGYTCFTPALLHRAWKKLTGNYNGPSWVQERDIRKTMAIIKEKTGREVTCWRNHMYMHGDNTSKILASCGIRWCSDQVCQPLARPYIEPSGLIQVPINIIPDHEHLYHAERTPEWVAWWIKRYRWSDVYGPASYSIGDWTELVLAGLKENARQGVTSTLIIHPITMYLCDRFKSFEKILDYIAQHPTIHMDQIHPLQEADGR